MTKTCVALVLILLCGALMLAGCEGNSAEDNSWYDAGEDENTLYIDKDFCLLTQTVSNLPCPGGYDWCDEKYETESLVFVSRSGPENKIEIAPPQYLTNYEFIQRANDKLFLKYFHAEPHSDSFTYRIGYADLKSGKWSLIPLELTDKDRTYRLVEITPTFAYLVGGDILYQISFDAAAVTNRYKLPYETYETRGFDVLELNENRMMLNYWDDNLGALGTYYLDLKTGEVTETAPESPKIEP